MSTTQASDGFYVLYNDCYGGFNISDEAQAEYDRRKQEYEAEKEDGKKKFIIENYDPILIDMFLDEEWNTNSTRLNGPRANLKMAWFPNEYAGCIDIEEYDGKEMPSVNKGRYYNKQLKKILYDDATDDSDKVRLARALINSKNY
jgi:hypothetical protein